MSPLLRGAILKIKLDSKNASQAAAIYESLGLNLEVAINAFLVKSIKVEGFPFVLGPTSGVDQSATQSSDQALPTNAEITKTIKHLVETTLDPSEIAQLLDAKYCKEQFGVGFPVLLQLSSSDPDQIRTEVKDGKGYNRYSTKVTAHRDEKLYAITTQWLDRHRGQFKSWSEGRL